jgi:translocator protein
MRYLNLLENTSKLYKSQNPGSDMNKSLLFLIVILIAFSPGIIGSFFTGAVDSEWYRENRPDFTPPNYVFPIAWTILYLLIGLSLYFAWTSSNKAQKKNISMIYGINLAANAAWTPVFFALQMPLTALFILLVILVTTAIAIYYTHKINKTSPCLLIPYFLWLVFAGVLNYSFI